MDHDEELPRVLVISPNVFNRAFGGGTTLTSLFQGWPAERLAQIHSDEMVRDESVCHHFLQLNANSRHERLRRLPRQASWVAKLVTGNADYALLWARLRAEVASWVTSFGPDVILAQPCSLAMLRFARKVSVFAGVPVVLDVSDDWVADWPASVMGFRVPPFSNYVAAVSRNEFAAFVTDASRRMCVSELMAAEYEHRYGVDFEVIYNPIDLDAWAPLEPVASRPRLRPFSLLYSGSLYPHTQLASLRDMSRAVVQANRQLGAGVFAPEITLEICTHPAYHAYRSELEKPPYVHMTTSVPYAELPTKLRQADLLVLPVNFDAHSQSFIRYSTPGKLSEYMASGTPMLLYGPRGCAPIEYALQRGFGHVQSDPGTDGLATTLLTAIEDADGLRVSAARARRIALEEHGAVPMRRRFRRILLAAANGSEVPV